MLKMISLNEGHEIWMSEIKRYNTRESTFKTKNNL